MCVYWERYGGKVCEICVSFVICLPFPHGSNPVRARPVVSGFIRCSLQADELEKSYKSTVQSHRPPPTDLWDCPVVYSFVQWSLQANELSYESTVQFHCV